jgi:hypothetical protein
LLLTNLPPHARTTHAPPSVAMLQSRELGRTGCPFSGCKVPLGPGLVPKSREKSAADDKQKLRARLQAAASTAAAAYSFGSSTARGGRSTWGEAPPAHQQSHF